MMPIVPGIAAMTPMSPTMYRLACHMAHLAGNDPLTPVIGYPVGAVLHAAVALEAFLNEEMARYIHADPTKWKGPLEALERLETENKWQLVPLLLFGKTLPKGAEPFQSFRALIRLRNELVHYHAEFTEDEKRPAFARDLETRFEFTKFELPPAALQLGAAKLRVSWQNEILNRNCARWACITTRNMVLAWYELWASKQDRAQAEWEWSLEYLEGRERGEPPASVSSVRVDPGGVGVVDLQNLGKAATPESKEQ
jgi:hypothetical protein